MGDATLLKRPAEAISTPVAFAAGVQSVALVDVVPRGLVTGGAALDAQVAVNQAGVRLDLAGGADGERYRVVLLGTTASAQELQIEVEVLVIDPDWIMPDGGAPWLSIDAFVRRFGLDEVVRMTDGRGDGRIDRDLLVATLIDAQAIAEASLATKYALPLAVVPPIVQTIVADLARARLYPGGAPEGVTEQAKAAMRMLERIQSGAMTLAVEARPADAISETPVMIAPGRRAYPDGLAGY
ncbi:DUF1320 domain-containing protein [Sphingomonas sp. SFZ2018-12]|uniref:DUF1320 domain-containing protein n=1 Tax=Sphingomonas sp. SFZ2018-12 TaxID=2683197 RepID=UPI001F0D6A47|nr:DUF1320 domain-containing protein [Sphingomonas sp. SFZ2018-12]MCH4893383.1 DUF1320 domain-containing protein [Sphingomonas sp. SFZ2018-12]